MFYLGLVVLHLVKLCYSESLDLEDLNQYKSVKGSPHDLTGDTIWISGREDAGFDIVLSSSTNAKVQGVLEACGQADDKCYQDVRNVLRSAHLEIDHQLTRRTFLSMLQRTAKKVGAVFSTIAAILEAKWYANIKEQDDFGMFIPANKGEDAANLGTATAITISTAGKPFLTVTPTPDPTTLQGAKAPSITPIVQPSNGFSNGDLAAVLDKDLPSRINEVMQRSKDCEDGRKFDSEHGSRKRAGSSYGNAICGAQAVAVMTGPGGPFNDVLLIDPGQFPFGWADPMGDVARAANAVVDFVLAYAPALNIDLPTAEQIGNFLFGLALDTIMEDTPLQESNRIHSSLVTSTRTASASLSASSTSNCPDPTRTPLFCGYSSDVVTSDCDARLPKKDDKNRDVVCDTGKFKECKCNAPNDAYVFEASKEEQEDLANWAFLWQHFMSQPPEPKKEYALNIILQQRTKDQPTPMGNVQVAYFEWLFYATTQGTASACALFPAAVYPAPGLQDLRSSKPPPFPSGSFKVDVARYPGCEYKNDGTGNAESLWCGAKSISCFTNPLHDKPSEGSRVCQNLDNVLHLPMVYCEW